MIVVEDGNCGSWSSWSSCSISCIPQGGSAGQRSRSRPCIPPKNGGRPCDCPDQREPCAGPSGTINHCPVNFEWESWTTWSSCSASCGDGLTSRVRSCTEGRHGGEMCPDAFEKEELGCNLKECPNCQVSRWSTWSRCSSSCGGETQTRNRLLKEADPENPRCHSLEARRIQSCKNNPCRKYFMIFILYMYNISTAVDGYWGSYGEWSPCRDNEKKRWRHCRQPKYGGKACQGSNVQYEACLTEFIVQLIQLILTD